MELRRSREPDNVGHRQCGYSGFNAEKSISAAVQSVLEQTYEVGEIIVVDDGSTDETARIADQFPKVSVIRRANGGQGAARNTGIAAATGEWIAFLDADDTWHPQKTEHQLGYAGPRVGVIHANRYQSVDFVSLWHRMAHVTPSGALVRKETLAEVGGFDESRSILSVEDLNLWLRIALTQWQFARSEGWVYQWTPQPGHQSGDDFKMASAELANADKIGLLVNCSVEELEWLKRNIRLEYARNLIGAGRMQEARELLEQCSPGPAALWLRSAAVTHLRRAARQDVLRWLHSIELRGRKRKCDGACTLAKLGQARCSASSC